MKTEVTCCKCGTKLEVRGSYWHSAPRFEEPTKEFFVVPCPKCLNEKENETCRNIHHSPKHGW